MRNESDWPQYNDRETHKFKKKTAANDFDRRFDKFKAKFRNDAETMVNVMASVAMFPVTMMVYVMLRVEQRQGDHKSVQQFEFENHFRFKR